MFLSISSLLFSVFYFCISPSILTASNVTASLLLWVYFLSLLLPLNLCFNNTCKTVPSLRFSTWLPDSHLKLSRFFTLHNFSMFHNMGNILPLYFVFESSPISTFGTSLAFLSSFPSLLYLLRSGSYHCSNHSSYFQVLPSACYTLLSNLPKRQLQQVHLSSTSSHSFQNPK